ncbi:MAG: tRNA pseudouridine(13) synthase TruD [Thiogranum sp.]|nr:tRNA pseudouridine(13) synthase TruD [Thiogranum sp.]
MNARVDALEPIPLVLPYAWGGPVGNAVIRSTPEDFQVTEVPLVAPTGEGEHSWLYVRKRNANTQWVLRQLAQYAEVGVGAVSYAGLKDRSAVTEQWFSVHLPGRPDPDWLALRTDEFQVLEAHRHNRKLKTGALRGNRFRIHLRGLTGSMADLDQRLRQVQNSGIPNGFGSQRFGHGGANLQQAEHLLLNPRVRLPRDKRGLYLSAVRSALFNRVLAARIEDRCWDRALPGDALQLAGRSACFVVEVPDPETGRRIAALEVHPTGPLCGDGAVLLVGDAAAYEAAQLQPYEAWIAALRRARVQAARRALRVLPSDLHWEFDAAGDCVLEFFLPAGSYATSLLREIVVLDDTLE